MKNNKGITLIAASFTVMLLIIIAAITINATVGDNGVIKRAEKAKYRAEFSEKYDDVNTAIARAYSNSGTTNLDVEILARYFGNSNVKYSKTEVDYSGASAAENLSSKTFPIYVVFEDNTIIYIKSDVNGNVEVDLNLSKTSNGTNAKSIME